MFAGKGDHLRRRLCLGYFVRSPAVTMTALGQTRQFDDAPIISDLRLSTGIIRPGRLVRSVPNPDINGTRPAREPGVRLLGMKVRRA
jgi:hypothetical protein